MTDEQLIKALECCAKTEFISDCAKCEMFAFDCKDILIENALDLINRQKAEIEKLEKENEKQKATLEAIDNEMMPLPFETDFDKAIKTAKSEAIKKFAKELKNYFSISECYLDIINIIDNFVKEMME